MKKIIASVLFSFLLLTSVREAQALSRSPSSLAFPNTLVGSTSAPQQALLLRGLTLYADVGTISISGSADFSIPPGGDQCTGRTLLLIPSVSQCSVTVVFSPTVAGYQTATLHLNTSAGNRTVALSGTGTNPDIVFSSVSFNATNVGSFDTQTVTITNNGTADFDVAFVGLMGTNPNLFLITSDHCTGNVLTAGGGNCDVDVRFTPENGGSFDAQLNVASASLPSASLALTADGLNPDVAVTVPVFANTDVGSSDTQTFTVTNNGSGDLNVTAILLSGASSGQFSINQDNCSGTVVSAAGDTCTVDVTFRPETDGTLNAIFNVLSSNAPGNASAFSADATFTSLVFTPLTFANTQVGESDIQTVTITNTGSSDFLVMGLTLSGVDPDQFAISQDNCTGQTLAGSGVGTCTVALAFNPQTVGISLANLNVLSPTGVSSTSFNATGITAATPLLALSATSLTYQTSAVGAASDSQTLTLSNTGNADLIFTNILITGPNASTFTVNSDGCSSTVLSSGASCNLVIIYTGSAVATQTGVLIVSSNDTFSANRVTLTGSVVLPTPSVTPVNPANNGSIQGGPASGCSLSMLPSSFSISAWSLLGLSLVVFGWIRTRKI